LACVHSLSVGLSVGLDYKSPRVVVMIRVALIDTQTDIQTHSFWPAVLLTQQVS